MNDFTEDEAIYVRKTRTSLFPSCVLADSFTNGWSALQPAAFIDLPCGRGGWCPVAIPASSSSSPPVWEEPNRAGLPCNGTQTSRLIDCFGPGNAISCWHRLRQVGPYLQAVTIFVFRRTPISTVDRSKPRISPTEMRVRSGSTVSWPFAWPTDASCERDRARRDAYDTGTPVRHFTWANATLLHGCLWPWIIGFLAVGRRAAAHHDQSSSHFFPPSHTVLTVWAERAKVR